MFGDLELEANNVIQTTSSIVASFTEYPKPGSPTLQIYLKDGTSFRKAKVTASALAIPLSATLVSPVTTGFEGKAWIQLTGNGLVELAQDESLNILICGAFKCQPDLYNSNDKTVECVLPSIPNVYSAS